MRSFRAVCLFVGVQFSLSFKLPVEALQALSRPPQPTAPLAYRIFSGESCWRHLSCDWIEKYGKSVTSLLMMLCSQPDAAHEVVLGVNRTNFRAAEIAATHPGSGWSTRHPLSTEDDWIHALIHRDAEGNLLGEGNHTGWENAKYWATGGPKRLDRIVLDHPVARQLATAVRDEELRLRTDMERSYSVLADGGSRRTVWVPPDSWDPVRFIDLLRDQGKLTLPQRDELERLRLLEYRLLLEHCWSAEMLS